VLWTTTGCATRSSRMRRVTRRRVPLSMESKLTENSSSLLPVELIINWPP
jgi:hypothetical protein